MTSLLYSQTLTVEGFWNGGGTEVYTKGNEHYCFKPRQGSEANFKLDSKEKSLNSCVYLMKGDLIASKCRNDPTLRVKNLDNVMYKIIVGPLKDVTNVRYVLDVNFDGEFGRCADYYQAGFLGMDIEMVNALLGLSGLMSASVLMASLVYVILTIGNF